MSEVKRWAFTGITGLYVDESDFNAEHALRLEAERKVDELRERLDEVGCTVAAIGMCERELQAKLDTAMGLLREVLSEVPHGWGASFSESELADSLRAFLNTSTEGKDHG